MTWGSTKNMRLTVVFCSRKYNFEGFGSGKDWMFSVKGMVWEVALLWVGDGIVCLPEIPSYFGFLRFCLLWVSLPKVAKGSTPWGKLYQFAGFRTKAWEVCSGFLQGGLQTSDGDFGAGKHFVFFLMCKLMLLSPITCHWAKESHLNLDVVLNLKITLFLVGCCLKSKLIRFSCSSATPFPPPQNF